MIVSLCISHIRLNAVALICKKINSDQFSEVQCLILAIHEILNGRGTFVNEWWFCGHS
jgi:hypothetical protein